MRCKVQARRTGRASCETRTKSAGLMLGSGVAITLYYVLAAGHRAVLESRLLGSMLGSPDFVRCWSGLGFGFSINFCISSQHTVPMSKKKRGVPYYLQVWRCAWLLETADLKNVQDRWQCCCKRHALYCSDDFMTLLIRDAEWL